MPRWPRDWWFRTLVGRVYALYTGVLLVFVIGGLLLFYRHQFGVELEQAQLRAESLAAVVQPAVSDSAVIGDYDTIRRTLERAVRDSSMSSASFIDLRGGVLRVPREQEPLVVPPQWLERLVAERLYDINQTVVVGGRDYGVLRMTFAADRIAGALWEQTQWALALALGAAVGGLVLIRYPLVRWLGNLNRVQAFDEALRTGLAVPALPNAQDVPLELRETFEVLGRAVARLRHEVRSRDAAVVSLRHVLEGLTRGDAVPIAAAGGDDLAAISSMIEALVDRMRVRGDQLDAIFALSADGFLSFDSQRRVHYASPAFVRLTGLSESLVLGADESRVEALLRAQCDGAAGWRGLAAMRQDSGEAARRERLDVARPVRRVLEIGLRQGHGGGVSQVLSMRDVTHETEVDLMKSEFLSTAAHELRTPMSSIYGFSELMLRRRLSPERQQEVVATIHRQSELMIAIINELLDLARIEARRGQDFVLESCDLTQLLPALVADFRAPGQRPEPQLDLGTRPAPVNVDPAKLRQALLNVLSNAYKYSPGGGAVDVRLLRDDGLLRLGIEVRDHGIGMTPEQLARVSERFYRADASGTIPGTGLGMSIVKEIVELLGGSLALASEAGQGTTVTLWLPCAGVDAGTRAQALEEA